MCCSCIALLPCCAHQVRTASCAGTACVNSFGDEQLAVDMLADKLLFEALRFSVSTRHPCCCMHICHCQNWGRRGGVSSITSTWHRACELLASQRQSTAQCAAPAIKSASWVENCLYRCSQNQGRGVTYQACTHVQGTGFGMTAVIYSIMSGSSCLGAPADLSTPAAVAVLHNSTCASMHALRRCLSPLMWVVRASAWPLTPWMAAALLTPTLLSAPSSVSGPVTS